MGNVEAVLYLEVDVILYLMNRWGINKKEFLDLDEKYGIIDYVDMCYEPFHLIGIEGIAKEVEEYINTQGGIV